MLGPASSHNHMYFAIFGFIGSDILIWLLKVNYSTFSKPILTLEWFHSKESKYRLVYLKNDLLTKILFIASNIMI